MKTLFYAGETQRWSYFWENPNLASIFLACLLVAVWIGLYGSLRLGWRSTAPALALEFLLVFLLCQTGSRTGMVAAAVGFVYIRICVRRGPVEFRHQVGRLAGWRLAGIMGLVLFSTLSVRIRPDFLLQDSSIHHRLVLWSKGPAMLADVPFGWGAGESGYAYQNWYQPAEIGTRWIGMVSSFLQLGIERGVLVLWLALVGCLALVFAPIAAMRAGERDPGHDREIGGWERLGCIGGVVFVTWLAGASCNTVFGSVSLSRTAEAAAAGVVMGLAGQSSQLVSRRVVSSVGLAFGLPTFLMAAILVGGYLLVRPPWALQLVAGGVWLRPSRTTPLAPILTIMPDRSVLGNAYGKRLRQLLLEEVTPDFQLFVLDPRYPDKSDREPVGSYAVFLLGENVARANKITTRYVIINPTLPPEAVAELHPAAVILGAWDELGLNDGWARWAAPRHIALLTAPGVGQDISLRWTEAFRWALGQLAPAPLATVPRR